MFSCCLPRLGSKDAWQATCMSQSQMSLGLSETEAWGTLLMKKWFRHRKPAQFVLAHSSWSLCFIVCHQQGLRFFSHCSCATIHCTGFFSGFCRSSQRGCFIDFIEGKMIVLQKPLTAMAGCHQWVVEFESSSVLFECGCFVRAAIHWEIKYAAPLHRETVLKKLSWHGQIARPSILLSLSVEFSQMPEPNRAACRFGTDMHIEVTPSLDSFRKKHCLFWNCLCQGKRFGKFWLTHVWCTE